MKWRNKVQWINSMEETLYQIVQICTMLMELFGICVLAFTAVKCIIRWIRHEKEIRLSLAKGIALALEFKLGGEVLRTVVVREWSELEILGAIIVLRGLLSFLIHLEIKTNRKQSHRKRHRTEMMIMPEFKYLFSKVSTAQKSRESDAMP